MKVGVARAGEQQRWIVQPGVHQTIRDGRQDRRSGHVAGHVGLGVVGAVVLLVHVLLEDVAEDVGVDLVVIAAGMLVEVPAPLVEEPVQPLERVVGDPQAVPPAGFDLVHLEHAAVDEGHGADELRRPPVLRLGRAAEPFVEQRQQEVLPVGVGGVIAAGELGPCQSQPAAQVLGVAVEEAALLDEVDEHQPVQQHRRVPVAVAVVVDALDDIGEGAMLLGELPVEAAGDLLGVERAPHPVEHHAGGERRLLGERERRSVEPLQHRFAGRIARVTVVDQAVADPAGPLLGPQPQVLARSGEHDELVAARPAQRSHDPMLLGTHRQAVGAGNRECRHALLVSNRQRCQIAADNCGQAQRRWPIPPHLADEQALEVALGQQDPQPFRRHSRTPLSSLSTRWPVGAGLAGNGSGAMQQAAKGGTPPPRTASGDRHPAGARCTAGRRFFAARYLSAGERARPAGAVRRTIHGGGGRAGDGT